MLGDIKMKEDIIENSKILIVDDEPGNLSILFEYLILLNADVRLIQESEKTIKIAEISNPDIILLDIIMPGMNGYDVCRKLKENKKTSDIPVIFMSSLSEIDDIIKGFECGVVDYITKPVRKEEVLLRISTHLKIRWTEKELKAQSQALKEMNDALKEANDNLKEINETKHKILSIISHDLRSPIGNISSFADMIISDFDYYNAEKIREYLDLIKFSSDSCYYLIDNILKWGLSQRKQFEVNPKSINLKNLLFLELLHKLIEEFLHHTLLFVLSHTTTFP